MPPRASFICLDITSISSISLRNPKRNEAYISSFSFYPPSQITTGVIAGLYFNDLILSFRLTVFKALNCLPFDRLRGFVMLRTCETVFLLLPPFEKEDRGEFKFSDAES